MLSVTVPVCAAVGSSQTPRNASSAPTNQVICCAFGVLLYLTGSFLSSRAAACRANGSARQGTAIFEVLVRRRSKDNVLHVAISPKVCIESVTALRRLV